MAMRAVGVNETCAADLEDIYTGADVRVQNLVIKSQNKYRECTEVSGRQTHAPLPHPTPVPHQ